MKRKLFVIAFFLMASAGAFSQSKLTDEQKKEFKTQLEAYKTKLNLNDDQASKMEEINLTYFEGLADLKRSPDSRLAKYKKLKSLVEERDSKAKKILNAEQYKVYLQHQREMKTEFRERRTKR